MNAKAVDAEQETLRKDAERYRWLRDTGRLYLGPIVGSRMGVAGKRHIISAISLGAAPADVASLDDAIDFMR